MSYVYILYTADWFTHYSHAWLAKWFVRTLGSRNDPSLLTLITDWFVYAHVAHKMIRLWSHSSRNDSSTLTWLTKWFVYAHMAHEMIRLCSHDSRNDPSMLTWLTEWPGVMFRGEQWLPAFHSDTDMLCEGWDQGRTKSQGRIMGGSKVEWSKARILSGLDTWTLERIWMHVNE